MHYMQDEKKKIGVIGNSSLPIIIVIVDLFFLLHLAYTQATDTTQLVWSDIAAVKIPLDEVFALFFCLVIVLPSPIDANAGAAASVAITNVAAANTASNPRVVWFILCFVTYH